MDLILSKAMLDCMQNLRRRLRVELELDIHLSEPNAITNLIAACEKSDSIRTRELGLELARLTGQPAGSLQAAAAPLESQPAPGIFPTTPAAAGEKLVRIYRGQRVYV